MTSTLPDKVKAALRFVSNDPDCIWRVDVKNARSDEMSRSVYSHFRVIGNGSFGVVCYARDLTKDENVAIKIVYQDRKFKNRELQIMKMLQHQNIVRLREYFYRNDEKNESDVYLNLVLDYVPDTVFNHSISMIKRKQQISHFSIKLYTYQMLRALAYMHGLGICHRDIKPQNLLLDSDTGIVKLCDFGSAKILVHGEPNVSYICSRYYRAPELLMGCSDYTTAVDIWSAGCVLAELFYGSPIFPGNSDVDQMVQIIKILGTPSEHQLERLNPKFSHRFPQIKATPWKTILYNIPEHADNLLSRLLEYEPKKRVTAIEALTHPFFDELRKQDCKMPDGSVLPPLFDFTYQELAGHRELVPRLVPLHCASTLHGDGDRPVQVKDQPQLGTVYRSPKTASTLPPPQIIQNNIVSKP